MKKWFTWAWCFTTCRCFKNLSCSSRNSESILGTLCLRSIQDTTGSLAKRQKSRGMVALSNPSQFYGGWTQWSIFSRSIQSGLLHEKGYNVSNIGLLGHCLFFVLHCPWWQPKLILQLSPHFPHSASWDFGRILSTTSKVYMYCTLCDEWRDAGTCRSFSLADWLICDS